METETRGIVRYVSPRSFEKYHPEDPNIPKVGDKVLFKRYAGFIVKHTVDLSTDMYVKRKDVTYRVIQDTEVVCKINEFADMESVKIKFFEDFVQGVN